MFVLIFMGSISAILLSFTETPINVPQLSLYIIICALACKLIKMEDKIANNETRIKKINDHLGIVEEKDVKEPVITFGDPVGHNSETKSNEQDGQ